MTPVSLQDDSFHYDGPRAPRKLLTVVKIKVNRGVAMSSSTESLLHSIVMLVIVTLAVTAMFDWSGLSS